MKDSLEVLATVLPIASVDEGMRTTLSRIDPSTAADLVRHLYREFKNSPHGAAALKKLAKSVEFSTSTPQDFVSQLVEVYDWLHKQNFSAGFDDVLEYVNCALEGSSLQPGHSIQWYLEQYGFEKRVSKC